MSRPRPTLLVAGGAVICAATYWSFLHLRWPGRLAIWIVFAAVLIAIIRVRPKKAVLLVVACSALVQIPGLTMAPQGSTDAYRYVWDGRVQLAGHSPYTRAPLDNDLANLRDPVLFPGLTPAEHTGVHGLSDDTTDDPRTRINRPHVPTIYPPVAQVWFAAVAAVTPWSAGTFGVQLAAALAAIATAALLASKLKHNPLLALGFGLCPAVALEAGNDGHVELLMTLLTVAAVVTSRRRILSGVLLGLAIGTKLVPLLVAPAIRTGVKGRLATAATLIMAYLPYLLTAGWLAFGYLPGYVAEEGFDGGTGRYALLGLVLPAHLRTPVAVLLGAALAAIAWHRAGRDGAAVSATWLFGAAVLIGTPAYPWYTLPLLALAVLSGRWEWLAVVVAAHGAYAAYDEPARITLWYSAALLAVIVAVGLRRLAPDPGSRAPSPAGRPRTAPPRRTRPRSPRRPRVPAPR